MSPIKLYGFTYSGHSHRVRLFLELLRLPYEWIEVDLKRGDQKQAAFLAMNPFGQVPVIDDQGEFIADSNAILVYLAGRYGRHGGWWPDDALTLARIQRWLSLAAGPLAYNLAAARVAVLFKAPINVADLLPRAAQLLARFEQTLQRTPFLTGDQISLADIANYTYVAHAPEGGIALEPYPAVQAWLRGMEALPGFVGMPAYPVAASAPA